MAEFEETGWHKIIASEHKSKRNTFEEDMFVVNDDGIYVFKSCGNGYSKRIKYLPKETFIEAYNKYILGKE